MTCEQIDTLIDTLAPDQWPESARVHVAGCERCLAQMAAEHAWRGMLGNLPVEPMREGFADRAFARVRSTHAADENREQATGFRHWFAAGFAGAAAAGLALWALLAVFQPWGMGAPNASFQLAVNQQRNIALAFNAPSDIQGVTLSIQLPENFEIAGYTGKHALQWKTDLKKGRNVLKLPVVAIGQGEGRLVARLSRKQTVKTIRLQLISKNNDLSSQARAAKLPA